TVFPRPLQGERCRGGAETERGVKKRTNAISGRLSPLNPVSVPVPLRHAKVNALRAVVDKPVNILWTVGEAPVESTRYSRERRQNVMPTVIRRRFVPPMVGSLTRDGIRASSAVGIRKFS